MSKKSKDRKRGNVYTDEQIETLMVTLKKQKDEFLRARAEEEHERFIKEGRTVRVGPSEEELEVRRKLDNAARVYRRRLKEVKSTQADQKNKSARVKT